MNYVAICGRLTRDPEYRSGETSVAKFTLAVDRKYKKNEADFISCTAFGKTADFINNYIVKGTKIIVEGRWQTGSFTNKEGQKIYTNECIVDQVEFAESKKSGSGSESPSDDSYMNIPEDFSDEIPFKKA